WIISLNVSLLFMSSSNCFLSDVSTISPTASVTTSSNINFCNYNSHVEYVLILTDCFCCLFSTAVTDTDDDPCNNYSIFDDQNRSPNDFFFYHNTINGYDDTRVEWHGWYRLFIDGLSAQMPEWCFSYMSCGGYSSLWLGGPHPEIEDGVVTREVYSSDYERCSYYRSDPIQVKACPGNYYVYKLIRTYRIIPAPAYCADPCLELSCIEDERCEEKHGVYGCSCKENHHRSQHDSFDSLCTSLNGQKNNKSFYFIYLFCKSYFKKSLKVHIFSNNMSIQANGTHFIYKNFIVGEPSSAGHLISRKIILKLPLICVYSQTQTLSMGINPLESLPSGQGTYQVRMIPYQDAEFSHPFTGSVNAELSKRIFVEVGVDGVDSRQFASVIDTCWATPVNDPHYPLQNIRNNKCPSRNDKVELLQNGVSTSSRFSFSVFIFVSNSTKIYLHCAIHLCLLKDNDCSVVSVQILTSISVGPLMWSDGNTVGSQIILCIPSSYVCRSQTKSAPSLCASLMILLISMINVLIFF
uniref:ZP domain-containing protein n=1 Tax=Sinocyclocheilus anshuiensis TaxID=1608454 RepID=A0A671KPF4_9TELE